MKNLLLVLFTMFLAYSVKANDLSQQEAMIVDSYEIVKESKAYRQEIEKTFENKRSLASIEVEDAQWVEYWQELMDDSTEDPTYWLNKAN